MSDSKPKIIQMPQTPISPKHICETCNAGIHMLVGAATTTPDGQAALAPMPVISCGEGFFSPRDAVSMIVMECAEYEEEQDGDEIAGGAKPEIVVPADSPLDPDGLDDESIDALRNQVLEQTKNDPDFVPVGGTPRTDPKAS